MIYVEDSEHMTPITNKFFTCKCCGVGYPVDLLPYTLTNNMIKELKININIRCGKMKSNWLNIDPHSISRSESSALSKMAHKYDVYK